MNRATEFSQTHCLSQPLIMQVASLVLAVVAEVLTSAWGSRYGNNQGTRGRGGQFSSAPSRYSFQWDVNDPTSGNYYGHQEQRNGDNTQGSYYVHLPDGLFLRVQYTVDGTGYQPVLTHEGEANYPSRPSTLPGTHPHPPLSPSGGTSTVSGMFSNPPTHSRSNPGTIPGRLPPQQYQPVTHPPGATNNDNNLPNTRPDLIPAPIPSPGLSPPSPSSGQRVVSNGGRSSAYIPLYPLGDKPQEASSLPFSQSTSFNTLMHSVQRHPSTPPAHLTHKPNAVPPSYFISPSYFIPPRSFIPPSSLIPPSPLATTGHSVKMPKKFPPFPSSPSRDSTQEVDAFSSVFFSPKKRSTLRPSIYPSTSRSTSTRTSTSVPPRHRSVHSLGAAPLLPRRNISNFNELASLPPRARPYAPPSHTLSLDNDSVHRQQGPPENHPQQSILPPRPIPTVGLFHSGVDSLPSAPLTPAGGSFLRPGMLPSRPPSPPRRLTAPPPPRHNLLLLAEALSLFPDRRR